MVRENWKGRCWHCGQLLGSADFNRESRCPGCQRASHSCRNCSFYAPGYANDCREPVAEHISDKETANFCDYFEPAENNKDGKGSQDPDNLLQAARDLFDA